MHIAASYFQLLNADVLQIAAVVSRVTFATQKSKNALYFGIDASKGCLIFPNITITLLFIMLANR